MAAPSSSIDHRTRSLLYILAAIARVFAISYLLHFVVRILLLTFAGILFAIFLDAVSSICTFE